MDGLEILTNVVVIAATNRPDIIDPALLRPGRFDRLLYVPPPDSDSRIQIIKIHTKKKPLADDVNIEQLADHTEGYTGADIASLSSAAVMLALREHVSKYKDPKEADNRVKELKIHMRHFEEAMKKIRPLSTQELNMYKRISEQFGKPELAYSTGGGAGMPMERGGGVRWYCRFCSNLIFYFPLFGRFFLYSLLRNFNPL